MTKMEKPMTVHLDLPFDLVAQLTELVRENGLSLGAYFWKPSALSRMPSSAMARATAGDGHEKPPGLAFGRSAMALSWDRTAASAN